MVFVSIKFRGRHLPVLSKLGGKQAFVFHSNKVSYRTGVRFAGVKCCLCNACGKTIKGKDVQVLAINVGESADKVFKFLGTYSDSFPLLLDMHGRMIKQYPMTGLPTTYIVNPKGRFIRRAVSCRDWDDPALYKQLLKLSKAQDFYTR